MKTPFIKTKGTGLPLRRRLGRQLAVGLALTGCLTALSGCRYTAAPADLLIAPQIPAGASSDGEMTKGIRVLLPEGSSLAIPRREKQPEAIRSIDLDGDGIPEALVSYIDSNGSYQLLAARQEGAVWKPWALMRAAGSISLDWLSVVDLDGDKRPEIVAGWTVNSPGSGREQKLQVYSLLNPSFTEEDGVKVLKPIAELPYETAETGDVDGDGLPEITLVNRNKKGTERTLYVYKLEGGKLTQTAMLPIFADVNQYDRLAPGKVSKDRFGLIAEGSVGAHSTLSTIFMWRDGGLEQVYPPVGFPDLGLSPSIVTNSDINGDGILEWSSLTEAPGQVLDPENKYASTIYYTEWMQWNGLLPGEVGYNAAEPFVPELIEYNNTPLGLSLQIPSRWRGQFTLSHPEDSSGVITVNYYNAKSGRIAPLWTLYAIPVKDWDTWTASSAVPRKQVINLRTAGGYVYTALQEPEPDSNWPEQELNQYRSMRLTDEQLASSLRLLPEN